jgi:hypothetical protein
MYKRNYSRAVVRPCTTAVVSGGKKNFEIMASIKYGIKNKLRIMVYGQTAFNRTVCTPVRFADRTPLSRLSYSQNVRRNKNLNL